MARGTRAHSKLRQGLAAAAVLLIGLTAGAVLSGHGRSSPQRPTAERPATVPATDNARNDGPSTPAGPGPRSSQHGVGVGFERSEAGAVAAGASYATAAQSWLYLSDEVVATAAEAVVVPGQRERLVSRLIEDVRLLREQLLDASGTVWYVVVPLATRLDAYDSSRAVVRVWIVRVLAADGVAVPQSSWRTVTFDLAWDGDWRVADVSEDDGPTPQLEAGVQAWSAAYFDETLAGFVRVGVQ